MTANPTSNTWDRGGCSQATGITFREMRPYTALDLDCTEQECNVCLAGASLTTCTPPRLTAGKSDADASGAAAKAA